jgi:uncharacterized membrane protein
MSRRIAILVGGIGILTSLAPGQHVAVGADPGGVLALSAAPVQGRRAANEFATATLLPSFGRGGDALAVNAAGTVVVGLVWDRNDILHAARWTVQNGSWTLTSLPRKDDAVSAKATGTSDQGGTGGHDYHRLPAGSTGGNSHAMFWASSTAGSVLGCNEAPAVLTTYGTSATAGVVVGVRNGNAAVWPVPSGCRQDLPKPFAAGTAIGSAVNGDGTIVGGSAGGPSGTFPVRWTHVQGLWQAEVLHTLYGLGGVVRASNGSGDLAGYIFVPCGGTSECQRAAVWHVAGGIPQLHEGPYGGSSSALDVNASGEVVLLAPSQNGINTGFIWSETIGMRQISTSRNAVAWALSDVRADGTRVAVGSESRKPIVWTIRNP